MLEDTHTSDSRNRNYLAIAFNENFTAVYTLELRKGDFVHFELSFGRLKVAKIIINLNE